MVSTLIYRSEICCMFSGIRYYGWPNAFITVSKTTESLEEAEKIKNKNVIFLIKNGWRVNFGGGVGKYGISPSGGFNLVTNYLFYLAISYLLVKKLINKKI